MKPNLLVRNAPEPHRFQGTLDIRATPRWDIFYLSRDGEIRMDHVNAVPNRTAINPFKRASKVQLYTLLQPFGFESDSMGLRAVIHVPTGFKTDFGSVPALAKWFVDDDDPDLLFASIIHDWLYKNKGNIPDFPGHISRKQADGILREAMLACGAPRFKADIVYRSVRLGGRGTWDEP